MLNGEDLSLRKGENSPVGKRELSLSGGKNYSVGKGELFLRRGENCPSGEGKESPSELRKLSLLR